MIERKYGVLGSRPYRPEPLYHLAAPTAVKWVESKTLGINIRDQGQEGCCTGFGTGRALRRALRLTYDPAAQFLYDMGRVAIGMQDDDSGAFVGDVVEAAAVKYGFPSEASFPYKVGAYKAKDYPNPDVMTEASHLRGRVKYRRLFGSEQLKHALADDPDTMVVKGFSVPAYFESAAMAKNGWLPLPGPLEQFLGGHCVCVSGFDSRCIDAPEPFSIDDNSWDETWGFAGRFRTPLTWYDDPRGLIGEMYAISPA